MLGRHGVGQAENRNSVAPQGLPALLAAAITSPGTAQKEHPIRDLIRLMSMADPLWGAPRIHGELLKLGIAVCQATVGRYMPWRPKAPSPTWRSFGQTGGDVR